MHSSASHRGSVSVIQPAEGALVQDARLVRWAVWLKAGGYAFLVLAIVPMFLSEPFRRLGGLVLVTGITLWWLCLTVRHACLAWSWPVESSQRRKDLVITAALSVPLVLLGIGFVMLLL